MWWRASTFAFAASLGCVFLLTAPAFAQIDPVRDAQTVYCLGSDQARPLVDTAVSLGLAAHGSDAARLVPGRRGPELTVAQWRRGHPADFARACAALVQLRKLPAPGSGSSLLGSGLGDVLAALISLFGGAAVALVSWFLSSRRETSVRAANDVYRALTAYYGACRRCLDAWRDLRGGALQEEMYAPYEALLSELQICVRRRPGWTALEGIIGELEELDTSIRGQSWERETASDSADRHLAALKSVRERVMGVVVALESPVLRRRKVRT